MNSKTPDLKLFGFPAHLGRWLLIPMGMIVLLCLGSVYSWSIFRKPLEAELNITATASLLPYTIALLFYASLMPVAGFYVQKIGSRIIIAIGGVVVGIGYMIASFAPNVEIITFAYGVIVGSGVGITYGVPMAVVAKWFPDKKGLAVGLTIVGFGLSPLVTAPLVNILINLYSVRETFRILGIAFTLIILLLATALKMPPVSWNPVGNKTVENITTTKSYPVTMVKSKSFYGLWICYAIGALVGLSAIGISSSVGEEVINIDANVAAFSVSLFAFFNGVSRPLFGWLCDRFQPRYIAIASYSLIIIASLLMISAKSGQIFTYLIAFSLFWFCLGGWLAMAPTITLRFFNPDKYPQNYGIVFTAYGIGALIGTLFVGQLRDWLGSYTYGFYPMAILAVVGTFVAQKMLKQ